MPRILRSPALFFLLGPTLAAQVEATATVRVGCSTPAAPNSLQAELIPPRTWLPNQDDLIVMEVESLSAIGNWEFEDSLPGFGGQGYFRWDGPNLFNTSGVDVLSFQFEIHTAGEYLLRVHNRHDHPDSSLENDCWVRLDSGSWTKLYQNTGTGGVGVWSFDCRLQTTGQKPKFVLNVGTHTFQISGRSQNFMIDRVHLMPQTTFGESAQFSESSVIRERPLIGQQFRVAVGDPTSNSGFIPGVAQTLLYGSTPNANYPCGSVHSRFGEILIALGGSNSMRAGPPVIWNGANSPALHTIVVPNDALLVGFEISLQAVVFQPGLARVTDAIDLVVGDV